MARVLEKLVYRTAGALIIIFIFSGLTFAGEDESPEIRDNAVKSLITGIKSDNEGLKRCSIYLVGKYKLAEAVEILSEELEDEENAKTKLLIALSLYQIGSRDGLKAIKNAALNDEDAKVRRICTEIFNVLYENSYSLSVEMGN